MCGIVGGFGSDVQNHWITEQTKELSYRGPDFQADFELTSHLHFGSARLAMTDPLPRSNQPFRTETSALIFNGEIYNHKKIRTELESEGLEFDTESDTEVLIKSLDYWGYSAAEKFQGMFAFAYYNFLDETLTLGRDSLGKKPLYYLISENTLHWSSSLNTLRKLHPKEDLNPSSIFDYLSLGYSIDPLTINQDIFSVLPGYFQQFKFQKGKLIETNRFRLNLKVRGVDSKQDFRESITSAVEARIEGHSAPAVSLSGGLDSAIVALVASQINPNVKAYSASWPDSDKLRYNDDCRRARKIAENLGIEFIEVEIFGRKDLDQNLREFVVAMEEPNSNPSGLSMLNLYRRISQDSHRLVLTGDGADEILGGYPRYSALSRVPNILKLSSKRISKILESKRTDSNSHFFQFLVSQSSNNNFDNWLHWHWNFTPSELFELSPSFFNRSENEDLRRRVGFLEPNLGANPVSFNMQMDRDIWLNMESNRKLDRISMHYSIEARSPFQDERVIASALHYMHSTKYKVLGKEVLRHTFPELSNLGVRDDKAGFISPIGHWLRGNPAIVQSALKKLTEALPFDANYLLKLSKSPNEGNYRRIMQLWSLIVLSYWIQAKV